MGHIIIYKGKRYPLGSPLNKILFSQVRYSMTGTEWVRFKAFGIVQLSGIEVVGHPKMEVYLIRDGEYVYFNYPQGWERELKIQK